jgi:hypothetical protein
LGSPTATPFSESVEKVKRKLISLSELEVDRVDDLSLAVSEIIYN